MTKEQLKKEFPDIEDAPSLALTEPIKYNEEPTFNDKH